MKSIGYLLCVIRTFTIATISQITSEVCKLRNVKIVNPSSNTCFIITPNKQHNQQTTQHIFIHHLPKLSSTTPSESIQRTKDDKKTRCDKT